MALQFFLNGQLAPPPVEWPDLQIEAVYDNKQVQPTITTSEFTFVNENAQVLKQWIEDGRNGTGPGIFEGVPFDIRSVSPSSVFDTFKGYIDLADDMLINPDPIEVQAKIKKASGRNTIADQSKGLTYGALQDAGLITDADFVNIPYIVEPEKDFIETALLGVTIYLMVQQLAEAIRRIVDDIGTISGILAAGISGSLGALILAIVQIAINIIYSALIINFLKDMIEELLEQLISPVRYFKAMMLRTMLEKGADKLGLTFQSSIADLDKIAYVPSQLTDGDLTTTASNPGIPQSQDFGYAYDELLTLCEEDLFNAQTVVKADGSMIMESLNAPFWQEQSTFVIPNTLLEKETVQYNTDELKTNIKIAFAIDQADFWTVNQYKGTSFEILTGPLTVPNNTKHVSIKGFDDNSIPLSLGNRKDELSNVEKLVKLLAEIIDGYISFFGGSSNFAQRVENRVGMMKISGRTFRIAKLVNFNGTDLDVNHRDTWSAKYLWDTYKNEVSFVENNFGGQWRPYKDIVIPFSFDNLLEVLDNAFCITGDGRSAKFESFLYNQDEQSVVANFRVREIYTKNLGHNFIEVE